MTEIAPTSAQPQAGLYVHIPFCRSRCAYCDFTTFADASLYIPRYLAALRRELALSRAAWQGYRFDSLYIGGGTPTILPPGELAALVAELLDELTFTPDPEVTVEANPDSVTSAGLQTLVDAGVNRLSLGVQSWQAGELGVLGRCHSAAQAGRAIEAARFAGIRNLSLDLMLGLPGQSLASWRDTLTHSIAYSPEHISAYTLTLEEDTQLARSVAHGEVVLLDNEACADQYALLRQMLAVAGYDQYELSNWARSECGGDLRSRHNLHYWRNQPYLGLGLAAFSYDGIHRWGNSRDLAGYLASLKRGELPPRESEHLNAKAALGETIMLGLRLVREGVRWESLSARFGLDARAIYAQQIEELAQAGWLEADDQSMRLAPRAYYLANVVLREFV
ncbi:MAG: radical SAM family heme chaperone HemW [Chloroflexi bacterium]|nr:radical SAM family heme chaperone HemW [Chloroflexota bacterium]